MGRSRGRQLPTLSLALLEVSASIVWFIELNCRHSYGIDVFTSDIQAGNFENIKN